MKVYSLLDTGRKLIVHKKCRRDPGRPLKVICVINLPPVSSVSNPLFCKVLHGSVKNWTQISSPQKYFTNVWEPTVYGGSVETETYSVKYSDNVVKVKLNLFKKEHNQFPATRYFDEVDKFLSTTFKITQSFDTLK